MSILIQKKGVLDTFQDLGRNGFRKFGINQSGAMDRAAVRIINELLGNEENEAALEMHFPAPVIKFQRDAVFALGGADFAAKTGRNEIENWKTYFAKKDGILRFTDKKIGSRCYLAIKGGFKLKKWLNSASTNLKAGIGGFEGRSLQTNDEIPFNSALKRSETFVEKRIARSLIPRYSRFPTVRILPGADFKDLTAVSESSFFSQSFHVGRNSDRMGFRLEGEPLHLLYQKEMLSSAAKFGTIQLLPDGQLVILMADHQTTGGYPVIGNIIEQDLPLVAQLSPGDGVGFYAISPEDVENAAFQFEKDLSFLKIGLRFTS